MATAYDKIYENVLSKLKTYDFANMTSGEIKEYLHDYLIPATAKFHVCKKNLQERDDTLELFSEDLSDTEVEIIGNYLLLEYIDSTYIRTSTLLKANLSSSDFNAFSPANMLDKLMSMRTTYLRENETLISRYAWMNKNNKK